MLNFQYARSTLYRGHQINFLSKLAPENFQTFVRFETSQSNLSKVSPKQELTNSVNDASQQIFTKKNVTDESPRIKAIDKHSNNERVKHYEILNPLEQHIVDRSYDAPLISVTSIRHFEAVEPCTKNMREVLDKREKEIKNNISELMTLVLSEENWNLSAPFYKLEKNHPELIPPKSYVLPEQLMISILNEHQSQTTKTFADLRNILDSCDEWYLTSKFTEFMKNNPDVAPKDVKLVIESLEDTVSKIHNNLKPNVKE